MLTAQILQALLMAVAPGNQYGIAVSCPIYKPNKAICFISCPALGLARNAITARRVIDVLGLPGLAASTLHHSLWSYDRYPLTISFDAHERLTALLFSPSAFLEFSVHAGGIITRGNRGER